MLDRHLFVFSIDLSNLAICHIIKGHNARRLLGFILRMDRLRSSNGSHQQGCKKIFRRFYKVFLK